MARTPVTVAGLLDAAARRIGTALGLERREARLEARALAAFAWRVGPAWLIAHDTDPVDHTHAQALESLLSRRLEGVPVAYLVGRREFFGRDFEVSPDVLIPRPDTELLVELALAHLPADRAAEVVDLGTGSGCIAVTLALERPLARVTAVDRSAAALAVARRNSAHFDAGVEFCLGDWFSAVDGRRFDLIVANPPYVAEDDPHLARGDVRFEPATALASGADGLADLKRLIGGARSHLRAGGWLLLEHGYNQAGGVVDQLRSAGFPHPRSWTDLAGILRVSGGEVSE